MRACDHAAMADAMVHSAVRRLIASCAWFFLPAARSDGHVALWQAPGDDSHGWVIVALVLTTALYAVGVMRLWRASGWGRGVAAREAVAFMCGELVLAATLLGTLDKWADRSFAAHMGQHEALMLVAAPLLVQGRPLAAWAWALTRNGSHRIRRVMSARGVRRPWRGATAALGATIMQLVVLFGWHIPAVFDYAVAHDAVHALQHASLLAAALCFWWAMRSPISMQSGSAASSAGVAIACLFITM